MIDGSINQVLDHLKRFPQQMYSEAAAAQDNGKYRLRYAKTREVQSRIWDAELSIIREIVHNNNFPEPLKFFVDILERLTTRKRDDILQTLLFPS